MLALDFDAFSSREPVPPPIKSEGMLRLKTLYLPGAAVGYPGPFGRCRANGALRAIGNPLRRPPGFTG
jgi:hypothetical protein